MVKNLSFTISALKKGGYIAEYQNYVTDGYRGSIAGIALHDANGRCLLSNVHREFIHLKNNLTPIKWAEGCYSGTEWYWRE